MKKINEKIKNLLSKEIYQDSLKIVGTLIIYMIVFSIFQAGYEFRNISTIKTKPESKDIERYKYFVTFNGDEDEYFYTEPKNLFSIIEGIEDLEIEYTEYYEGKKITTMNNKRSFQIKVDGVLYDSNFFEVDQATLKDRTNIEIIN